MISFAELVIYLRSIYKILLTVAIQRVPQALAAALPLLLPPQPNHLETLLFRHQVKQIHLLQVAKHLENPAQLLHLRRDKQILEVTTTEMMVRMALVLQTKMEVKVSPALPVRRGGSSVVFSKVWPNKFRSSM